MATTADRTAAATGDRATAPTADTVTSAAAGSGWTRDARYFEYSTAVDPIGSGSTT